MKKEEAHIIGKEMKITMKLCEKHIDSLGLHFFVSTVNI